MNVYSKRSKQAKDEEKTIADSQLFSEIRRFFWGIVESSNMIYVSDLPPQLDTKYIK